METSSQDYNAEVELQRQVELDALYAELNTLRALAVAVDSEAAPSSSSPRHLVEMRRCPPPSLPHPDDGYLTSGTPSPPPPAPSTAPAPLPTPPLSPSAPPPPGGQGPAPPRAPPPQSQPPPADTRIEPGGGPMEADGQIDAADLKTKVYHEMYNLSTRRNGLVARSRQLTKLMRARANVDSLASQLDRARTELWSISKSLGYHIEMNSLANQVERSVTLEDLYCSKRFCQICFEKKDGGLFLWSAVCPHDHDYCVDCVRRSDLKHCLVCRCSARSYYGIKRSGRRYMFYVQNF